MTRVVPGSTMWVSLSSCPLRTCTRLAHVEVFDDLVGDVDDGEAIAFREVVRGDRNGVGEVESLETVSIAVASEAPATQRSARARRDVLTRGEITSAR